MQVLHAVMKRRNRGAALIVAMALILVVTMIVMGTQFLVVQQLKNSKQERDYERALQLAEAGANAYLNMLANGAGTGANASYVPATYTFGSELTIAQFKAQLQNGTLPSDSTHKIRYPSGQSTQGYFAGQIGSGTTITVLSYGFSNGIVRRVKASAIAFSIFDWAALWGIDYKTGEDAWTFTGNASVVGASGADGRFNGNNNVTFYDGPVVWANASYGAPFNNPDPPVSVSAPNVPTGHSGNGLLASPLYRHFLRRLGLPTSDEAANDWALKGLGVTTNLGVAYFKTNNNNATGIRYLVRHDTTGVIRELIGNYTVMGNNDYQLDSEFQPTKQQLQAANNGVPLSVTGESFYGLRLYPGNYYFEQVTMQNSDHLYLRTFKDSEIVGFVAQNPDPRQFVVLGDPLNPNSGMAEQANVRVWIGKTNGNSDPATTFDTNTNMEYPRYASRFRIYSASRSEITVRGRNADPPPPFRVNLLAYNYYLDNANNKVYYGGIHFQSGTYMFGSLLGWQITVVGGTTIQKETPELGPGDILTYLTLDWRELK